MSGKIYLLYGLDLNDSDGGRPIASRQIPKLAFVGKMHARSQEREAPTRQLVLIELKMDFVFAAEVSVTVEAASAERGYAAESLCI